VLEITKIREFRITNENVFLFYHAFPITSGVSKQLWCIFCTVSLRESLCWRYTTAEIEHISLFHNLDIIISFILIRRPLVLTPVIEKWDCLPLEWCLPFFSNTLYFSLISYRYRASIPLLYINREVICLNRCGCTFSKKHSYIVASDPILSQIQHKVIQSLAWEFLETSLKSFNSPIKTIHS
jgi:hypothetical protein